jgi:8-oxo-dGTP diphosphatase
MKLIYGTGNPAKLDAMRRSLKDLPIEIIGLNELETLGDSRSVPDAPEDGETPLENARQKAKAYYDYFKMPVFSCDTAMYMAELPENLQPGVHAKRANGFVMTDEEMMAYYAGLAKKYGNLTTWYQNAICLILNETCVYESMDKSLSSEPFFVTDTPHAVYKKGFPIDSLAVDIKTGHYYYDLETPALDQIAVEEGFLAFFRQHLNEILANDC